MTLDYSGMIDGGLSETLSQRVGAKLECFWNQFYKPFGAFFYGHDKNYLLMIGWHIMHSALWLLHIHKEEESNMELTIKEMLDLKSYTTVYRNDCERKIRRIRRNFDFIQANYDAMPEEIIEDNYIIPPSEEIEELKLFKAEAVLISKKLDYMIKQSLK